MWGTYLAAAQAKMEFQLLIDDINPPPDIFVAMRVGDSQKLGRISSERLYQRAAIENDTIYIYIYIR